jgi:hypothetical protein
MRERDGVGIISRLSGQDKVLSTAVLVIMQSAPDHPMSVSTHWQ